MILIEYRTNNRSLRRLRPKSPEINQKHKTITTDAAYSLVSLMFAGRDRNNNPTTATLSLSWQGVVSDIVITTVAAVAGPTVAVEELLAMAAVPPGKPPITIATTTTTTTTIRRTTFVKDSLAIRSSPTAMSHYCF
jgi:hypothetical protein